MTYVALFVALSPLLVAAMRRPDWTPSVVALVAVGTALVCYLAGAYLDGLQIWPATPALLHGFVLALTSQQAIYLLLKETSFLQWLENQGKPSAFERARDRGMR